MRVKSTPLGRRQSWQRLCQMLVLSEVPCQVACLGSKHAQGKRLLFYKAAACGLNKRMLYSPLLLADLLCSCERLAMSPPPEEACWEVTFQLAPLLSALLPMNTESCREAGEPLPPAHCPSFGLSYCKDPSGQIVL